jgi:F-type H+-transporting ATPase subunit b
MLEALQETENWVALAFLLFLGLLAYLGVHRKLMDSLDQRQARIKAELEEARRLREEAQALLAEFERKGREAEGEAAAIIASAKVEAERLAAEAKTRMEEFVARRTKMAEAKITQAEAQALADVRSAAARKFSPPRPRARSPKIFWRAASRTSAKNSTETPAALNAVVQNSAFDRDFCA